MDSHVTGLIARRQDALDLLNGARAAGNARLTEAYDKILADWNRMLATYGVSPES